MRLIDRIMKKCGYTKVFETEYGVRYKKCEPQGYDHIVCVIRKENGEHIMQSYDSQVRYIPDLDWVMNECVGVEVPVLLLMWLKAKYLAIKYHWERSSNGRWQP